MLGLQIMYGVAVIGAGAVGAYILLFPALASKHIFFGELPVGPLAKIMGALWLAIGILALFGLSAPTNFLPILLLQFAYKSIWLLLVAVPNLLAKRMTAGLWFFTGLFALWVVALMLTIPFGALFAG